MKNLNRALMPIIILIPAFLFLSCKDNGEDNSYISFSVSPTGYSSLAKESQTQILTVSSPSAWTLASNREWVTANMYSGNAGRSTQVTISIAENTDENARSATLTLQAPGTGRNPINISVTQLGTSGVAISDPVVKWIYDELWENYYWRTAVQTAPSPDYNLPYDEFLTDFLGNLNGAIDADGTMDGGYYENGQRYIYSYIEKTEATTRADVDEFNDYTYGFDFIPMLWYDDNMTRVVCFVKWVREGSPAALAGLERGMWIAKYNGQTLTARMVTDVYYQFVNAYYGAANGSTLRVTTEDNKAITMTVAGTMELTPILKSTIVDSPDGKRVAYFMYNEFEVGPLNRGEYKFNTDMRTAFSGFSGVDALVVDLRYNGGGYTYCCQILTSLAANVNSSQVFNEMRLNSTNPGEVEVENFLNEPNSLNLNKVYVLTTDETASASELFINSLRGVGIDVVQIGQTTEGKNVGMHGSDTVIEGITYEMWPITFKSYNAVGATSDPNGMKPDPEVADWDYEVVYDLGDPREAMLSAALELIDGRTPKVSGKTRSESEQHVRLENTQKRRGLDGARIFPGEIEDIYRTNP